MSAASGIFIETCRGCATLWALPRERCPRCGGSDVTRVQASGRGRVFASTLVHRTADEAFRPLVPYWIALVDLEEGPRVMGHLDQAAPIGAPVQGSMRAVAGHSIPIFVADEDGRGL